MLKINAQKRIATTEGAVEHVRTPRPTQAERPKRQELRMPSAKASRTKSKATMGEPPQLKANHGQAAPRARHQSQAKRPKDRNGRTRPSKATRTKDKGRTWGNMQSRSKTNDNPWRTYLPESRRTAPRKPKVWVVKWTEFKSRQRANGPKHGYESSEA